MATIGEKITPLALDQLKSHPDGIRYPKLVDLIKKTDPGLNTNTIHGTIWDLASRLPKKVYKPSRGLFRLVEFKEEGLRGIVWVTFGPLGVNWSQVLPRPKDQRRCWATHGLAEACAQAQRDLPCRAGSL